VKLSKLRLLLLFVLLLSLAGCKSSSQKRAEALFGEGLKISIEHGKVLERYAREIAQIFTVQNRAKFPANRDWLSNRVHEVLPLLDESLRLENEAAEKFEESSRLWSKEQQRKGVALIAASYRKSIEIEQLFKEQALLVSDPTITDAKAFNEKFGRLNELVFQKQKESDAQHNEGKRLMVEQ
jgi:hypothetical protein